MSKLDIVIKEAILRGSSKQVRRFAAPMRRELKRLRRVVRELRREMLALRRVSAQWSRTTAGTRWKPDVSEEEARAARLSPGLIQRLRARLGLSQATLAKVVGVSRVAVALWERGRSAPSGSNRAALVSLRKIGRRDVKVLLARSPGLASARSRGQAARRRKPRRTARTRRRQVK